MIGQFELSLILIISIIPITIAQPEGWKMIDRFYGFRYQILSTEDSQDFIKAIQQYAEALACFGWVQRKGK